MKKIIVALLVCAITVLTFAGCQEQTDPNSTPTPTPNILTTVTPPPAESDIIISETADFWRYSTSNGKVTIYGYVGEDITEATIPSEINGLPVVALSETALCYKMKIKVSDSQYYCDLEKVTIPASIREVSLGLFAQCNKLREVAFEEGADFSIANNVLYNKDKTILYYCLDKDVTSFTIPSSVKIVAAGAFRECKKLKTVTIPGNVEYVYDYAFYGCDALETVTVQEGTKSIGNQVFSYCINLKTLYFPKTLLAIGEKSVSYNDNLKIVIYRNSPIHEFFLSDEMTKELGLQAHYIDYVEFAD